MNIPPYWAKGRAEGVDGKGKDLFFECWGWSASSVDDAQTMGQERSERVLQRFLAGTCPDRYAYADRPLREEHLQDAAIPACGAALITRNSYGAEILNVEQLMFVDVDLPKPSKPASGIGFLGRLFGRKPPPVEPVPDLQEEALGKLTALVATRPESSVRVYRTHSGLRYLFTHALFDATSEDVAAIMRELGADPLYATLCRAQKCFRARLTPKPWRCGVANPATDYPREGPAEAAFQQWLVRYQDAHPSYATCKLIAHLGTQQFLPGLEPLVGLHDERTQTASGLPLA